MAGWGRQYLTVNPIGDVLPCPTANCIPTLKFENVRRWPLWQIWEASEAFQCFRGTGWMREPCRSCDRRELDFGGCRCRAFLHTGDAASTDPACALASASLNVLNLEPMTAAVPVAAPTWIPRRNPARLPCARFPLESRRKHSMPIDVLTRSYSSARIGANVNETALTHANVNVNTFGKLFTRDGGRPVIRPAAHRHRYHDQRRGDRGGGHCGDHAQFRLCFRRGGSGGVAPRCGSRNSSVNPCHTPILCRFPPSQRFPATQLRVRPRAVTTISPRRSALSARP